MFGLTDIDIFFVDAKLEGNLGVVVPSCTDECRRREYANPWA